MAISSMSMPGDYRKENVCTAFEIQLFAMFVAFKLISKPGQKRVKIAKLILL